MNDVYHRFEFLFDIINQIECAALWCCTAHTQWLQITWAKLVNNNNNITNNFIYLFSERMKKKQTTQRMNRQLVIFRLLGVCVLCTPFRFDVSTFVFVLVQFYVFANYMQVGEKEKRNANLQRELTLKHTHSRVASEAKHSLCMTRDIKKCEFY